MAWENGVVDLARQVHQRIWRQGRDVRTQTKRAQEVCRRWQEETLSVFGTDRFIKEYAVARLGPGKEAIDLIDRKKRTAFELKVSPHNTHFEFYRDIFKVAVHNLSSDSFKIKDLIFITPHEGAKRLKKDFPSQVCKISEMQFHFNVEIAEI